MGNNYKSELISYQESQLFSTTPATSRQVYDVQAVFRDADRLQEYTDQYGQNRLGFYVMSTQDNKQQLKKYRYEDFNNKIHSKPISLICVYQTEERSWWIYYPEQLYLQIPDGDAYLHRVSELLNKQNLADSYADIINYTYELYPQFNSMVTAQATKIANTEVNHKYLLIQIQMPLVLFLITVAITVLFKDAIDSFIEKMRQKRELELRKKAMKQAEIDRKYMEDKRVDQAEWVENMNKTPKVLKRLATLVDMATSCEDKYDTKIDIEAIERIGLNLKKIEKIQNKLLESEDECEGSNGYQLQTSYRKQIVRRFYKTYFVVFMMQLDTVKYDFQIEVFDGVNEFNELIKTYIEITDNMIERLQNQPVSSIKINNNTIRKTAELDGLIGQEKIQEDSGVDDATEHTKEDS